MITDAGKIQIKRYLGGQIPSIGQSIAFGLGSSATTADTDKLEFEVERQQLRLVAYDFVEDRIIYKTTIPTQFEGKIYEVALVSGSLPTNSKLITSFDSSLEFWTGQTGYRATNARIGLDSLYLSAGANGAKTSSASNLQLNFFTMTGKDEFKFAFWNKDTNTSSVVVKFLTDSSNYYSFSIANPAAGYAVVSRTKDTANVQGSPDWSNITSIAVTANAKSSGAIEVDFDGIRVEDNTFNVDNSVLVAREVLASPYVKLNNTNQDVEFYLQVNI